MSYQQESEIERLQRKVSELKVNLKEWEHLFESKNGRAPSRQDIKENREISEKYKRYSHYKSRLVASKSKKPERRKDDLSSSTNASAPILMPSHASKERTAFGTPQKTRPQPATPQKARPPMSTPEKSRPEFATPRKIKPQFATPQKTKPQFATPQKPTATLAPFSPPESTTPIMSPAKLQEVGPTPQLSGKVLGILDSQSFSPFRTPIKAVTPNGLFGGVIKSSGGGLEDCPVISTPTSGSAKRKRDTNDENEIPETPHSNASSSPVSTPRRAVSRILPGTPKYFHQAATRMDSGINFSDTDSDSEEEFGGKGRLRAQRGLSSIIAELRENKYQQIDEEEDILREIENESYDPDMLGEVQGDEDELNPEHPEGFKVYKKKGQKRTTRRHIMRPNEAPLPSSVGGLEDCDEIQKPTRRSTKAPPQNFKRLKLHNSGFKGKPSFFKRRR